MARYIDADIAIYEIDKLQGSLMSSNDVLWKKNKMIYKGLCNARGIIDDIPTADVVPKGEVEELKAVIADHKASEERLEELYSNTKAEVAREIFAEIERLCDVHLYWNNCSIIQRDDIAELKKKYAEV